MRYRESSHNLKAEAERKDVLLWQLGTAVSAEGPFTPYNSLSNFHDEESLPLTLGEKDDAELSWSEDSFKKRRTLTAASSFRSFRLRIIARLRIRLSTAFLGSPTLFVACVLTIVTCLIILRSWQKRPSRTSSTLVFDRQELQTIWEWELESDHHPGRRPVPPLIGLRYHPTQAARSYPKLPSSGAYPLRPASGSLADFDKLLDVCDFGTGKYVRDCLEILRNGGGLQGAGFRSNREMVDYIYTESEENSVDRGSKFERLTTTFKSPNAGLERKINANWEPPLRRIAPLERHFQQSSYGVCDSNHPRIFHTFWTGPFTDKPYVTLLSFLFTQNLELHFRNTTSENAGSRNCIPQVYVWVDLDSSVVLPHPDAHRRLLSQLVSNQWSAPFLHARFSPYIHFELWNTTEQLDAIPEVQDHWRDFPLLNSIGHVVDAKTEHDKQGKLKPGKSAASTVLSDIARFVLLHRFGGIYFDADTLFLRDWEELWNWRGAFAYRWSYHDAYNTAILKMHKGSALGSFLFRTALRNGWDFHPFSITHYLNDGHLSELLFRLPDAMFDSTWLTFEKRHLDRQPSPSFRRFEDFLKVPSAAAEANGFNGFYRGAYAYHSHVSWGVPFDVSRNWPDLGERFNKSALFAEHVLRTADHDLSWGAVLKRTFEAYIRGEQPNMYGEWLQY